MTTDNAGGINFDEVAQAWEKWEDWLERSYHSFNEKLIEKAGINAGNRVLDLGSGSGFPSLLEAQRVGNGNVTGIDISEKMLEVASRRAARMNLHNIVFIKQEMDSLPFPDADFDAATARFSMMFVSSPLNTLTEVLRVLKPGGKFACSVWGDPERNPLPRKVIRKYAPLPPENPDVPGPYRFAIGGVLAGLFEQAGFEQVYEEEAPIEEIFSSGEQFVQHILEASALWGSILRKLPPEEFYRATSDMAKAAEMYRSEGDIRLPRLALVLSGIKPEGH